MIDWNWVLRGLLGAHIHNKLYPYFQGHREPFCENWEFTSYPINSIGLILVISIALPPMAL